MHHYYITGTSSGLGKALAGQLLLREDVHVYGISRNCSIEHTKYTHVYADLSDPVQVHSVAASFSSGSFTSADSIYLINNAGVIDPIKYAADFLEEEVQQLLQVNLIASIQLIRAFLQIPEAAFKSSTIVTISSGAATKVIDGWSLYGTAKAALNHFSCHVAKELKLRGNTKTRIFSIAPGVVDTAMQTKIRQTSIDTFSTRERFVQLHASHELVSPVIIAQKYLKILDVPIIFPKPFFRSGILIKNSRTH